MPSPTADTYTAAAGAYLQAGIAALQANDTTAPAWGGATLSANAITQTSYTLTASAAATDAVGVVGYEYSLNAGASWIANGAALTVNITGRAAGTTDACRYRAFDAAGNRSAALSVSVVLLAAMSVPAAGVSRLAGVTGDSLTEHGFGATPIYVQNGVLGAPLQLIFNGGHSGQSIYGLTTQLDQNYLAVSGAGLQGLPPLGWLGVRIGANTVRGSGGTGVPLDASNQGYYVTILNKCLAAAEHVIVFPVSPIGGAVLVKNTSVAGYNTYLQSLCAANPSRLHWIDDCTDLVDASGNIIPLYFTSDELHYSSAGTYQMGLTAQPLLAALFANQSYASPLVTSSADVYPTTPQWCPNPTSIGTAGTFGAGWSGQCVTGLRIEKNGAGNCTGTASIIAADAGDTNQVPWQRITPAEMTLNTAISVSFAGAGRTITSSDPAVLEQLVEVRLNALGANFNGLDMWSQASGSGKITKTCRLKLGAAGPMTKRLTLQQKFERQTPAATGAVAHYIYIGAATSAGAMGSIDFRCFSLRG